MIIRTLVLASVMVFAGSASAALKGDISNGKKLFESKENKGTTFYIAVPLSGMRKREGNKGLA